MLKAKQPNSIGIVFIPGSGSSWGQDRRAGDTAVFPALADTPAATAVRCEVCAERIGTDWLKNTLATEAPTAPPTMATARNSPRIFQDSCRTLRIVGHHDRPRSMMEHIREKGLIDGQALVVLDRGVRCTGDLPAGPHDRGEDCEEPERTR